MKIVIKNKRETDMLTTYETVRNITAILKEIEDKNLIFKGVIENEFIEAQVDTELAPNDFYIQLLNKAKETEDETKN